ncbi:MAG: deoxyribonuclease V [Armatimonadota bacterium]
MSLILGGLILLRSECDTMDLEFAMEIWDITPREATELQVRLRGLVRIEDDFGSIETVAGVDVRATRGRGEGKCAIVVLKYPGLDLVETVIYEAPVTFPYIPGLLAFREIPLIEGAFARLATRPDMLFLDGHGLAHPRRFGLACHAGVILDVPSIGCAKSVLMGKYQEPSMVRGSTSKLVAPDGDVVGYVVRTKTSVKPVFISPGHRVSRESAVRLALECTREYRIPEPTRLAHLLVSGALNPG